MTIYDTFAKKSIEIIDSKSFFELGLVLNIRANRQAFYHFLKPKNPTSYCFDRFVKEECRHKIFKMFCIDTQEEYECISFSGFLEQIGAKKHSYMFVELNKLKGCGKRKTVVINSLMYCLSENREKINNRSLCSSHYRNYSSSFEDNFKTMTVQRKLSNNLRSRIRYAVSKKSDSTLSLTGCSIDFLMGWLENQFQEGMTWENYGSIDNDICAGWHVDHIKPCVLFDLSDPEQQKKCFHYTNLQPLWGMDNFRKGGSYIQDINDQS